MRIIIRSVQSLSQRVDDIINEDISEDEVKKKKKKLSKIHEIERLHGSHDRILNEYIK